MSFINKLFSKRKESKLSIPVDFYSLDALTIDGQAYSFSELKGKKVLIVNLASKCGFTPQYEGLEKLYRDYSGKGFVILGFPSNDFLNQESGTESEIKSFCTTTYDVTFPLMSKVKVTGSSKHPVYKWLTDKQLNGKFNSTVKWNFQKYMISAKGELTGMARPAVKPDSPEILRFILG